MERWQATIKERNNPNVLKPTWIGDKFDYITDINIRDCHTRKYLREFWGLEQPDVEWYTLEKIG